MLKRTITAAIGVALLVVVCIYSHTLIFPILIGLMALIGVYEMLGCLGVRERFFVAIPAYLLAFALPFCTMFVDGINSDLTVKTLAVTHSAMYLLVFAAAFVIYMFFLFAAAVFCRRGISFSDVASAFVTTFYIVLAFTAILLLRFGENGQYYYLLCFLGAWITDIFAYFTGYFFGKHKLIPEISPKKTIEGSIGGILFCTASFVLFGVIVGAQLGSTPNYLVLGALGFLVSVLSQIGDLFASLIKREHDVKDYGKIFPGHGGVMDRFDSVIATAPLLLIVCTLDSILSLNLLL